MRGRPVSVSTRQLPAFPAELADREHALKVAGIHPEIGTWRAVEVGGQPAGWAWSNGRLAYSVPRSGKVRSHAKVGQAADRLARIAASAPSAAVESFWAGVRAKLAAGDQDGARWLLENSSVLQGSQAKARATCARHGVLLEAGSCKLLPKAGRRAASRS